MPKRGSWSFPVRGVRRRFVLLAALGTLIPGWLGCSRPVGPRWIPLSERLASSDAEVPRRPVPWPEASSAELIAGASGVELDVVLLPEAWTWMKNGGLWSARVDFHLSYEASTSRMRVSRKGVSVPAILPREIANGQAGFFYAAGRLYLSDEGVGAPEDVRVRLALETGHGQRPGRIAQHRLAGDGRLVLSGSSSSCRVDLPPGSALRFGTVAQQLIGSTKEAESSVFRVRLDGEVVGEFSVPLEEPARCAWHVVPLPEGGRSHALLELEVSGALGATSFIAPSIGPIDVGTRRERPWPGRPPDIVVFVADTFRADNLSAYGGGPGIAPNLDRLAQQSLCFRRAWSTATSTLPSHASLFSGYYPRQVIGYGNGNRLPESLDTIVETLAQAGYRTGAVTDGGFVSAAFGFGQGFEFFEEHANDAEAVLAGAEAFLKADDGRPTFLFVQTYRVHHPYTVSDRSRAELGERLGIQGQYDELRKELLQTARDGGAEVPPAGGRISGASRTPEMLELARRVRAHYLGGVADLDRLFQGFLETVEGEGLLETGYLIFTSDHGESFLDHDELFHCGVPHEEQTRVPLLIRGMGIVLGVVEDPVSLVDLAPTLARLANVPGEPDWPGRSLLERGSARTLFGFQQNDPTDDALFVLEGTRKVLLRQDGLHAAQVLGAYDLAIDPREQHDLAPQQPEWVDALLQRSNAALEDLKVPMSEGEAFDLDPQRAAELRALGY